MKEYIFTYDALKKMKEKGANLCWKDISKKQLYYLFVEEKRLSSQIAKLYDVTTSAVSSKRAKFNIKQKDIVVNKLIEDERKFLKEYRGIITRKETEQILNITKAAAMQFDKNKPCNNIMLSLKHKDLVNRNKKVADIISESGFFRPAKENTMSPYETEAILGEHFNVLDGIINDVGNEQWFCLYDRFKNGYYDSVLIPDEIIEECFYDIMFDAKDPDENLYNLNPGSEVIGKERAIKRIAIVRDFSDIKPSYIEILEEFRLFHNLYFDIKNGQYLKIYENGKEEEVIIIDGSCIKVKLKYLKEFLTYKEMSLIFYFNIKKRTENILKDRNYLNETFSLKDMMYNVIILKDYEDENICTIKYYGKKLIRGFKNRDELIRINDYSPDYVDFIADVDEYGNSVKFSCNPEKLIYYNVHKAGISYETRIFFKREVLEKYYRDYKKYSVFEDALKCGNSYKLPFKIENKKYIGVLLGDLGNILTYDEQLYWKSFNVAPDWIYKENSDNKTPNDFLFLREFEDFQKMWIKKHNWYLFKPLSEKEEYHIKTLHIPFADNQNEFDEQVRGLVKIIIDSVNEKELKKIINKPEIKGSISVLEEYLKQKNLKNYEKHIVFLRKLQTLRSVSIAHRKGKQYEEISKYFKIDKKPLEYVFTGILHNIIEFIKFLKTGTFSVTLEQIYYCPQLE